MRHFLILFSLLVFVSFAVAAETAQPFRIGVLPFGTLNWELGVLQGGALGKDDAMPVEIVSLANAEAGKIALLGERVDVIVSDWIWVANQRERHRDLQFYPYSTAVGALMVPKDSPIKTVSDLKGRKLGVAGGNLDKNWLLLKAMVAKTAGFDLEQAATPVFAAPPLLNQQLQQGRLDAVLNYWNFAARLEAQGFRKLLDGPAIQQGLGITTATPALGYVFRQSWATADTARVSHFFARLQKARNLICEDPAVWQQVAKLTGETDPLIQKTLKDGYCAGRVQRFGEVERKAVADIYGLLHRLGGESVTGQAAILPEGVFWVEP